ncbi:TPT-domain-containing protein [Myriangium duriaei CBS 260.36]|uniref:TPT-domain-containing protein n=1 Tax=Myriangium duriaei CBS 260.36 TaxID=1168546 RepID=A0A9P4MKD7_9PEZI|nr:TPT-domain-containing protein [Myriangium duriaei CBS 260.36]
MTLNGTIHATDRRSSSSAGQNGTIKFPEFSQDEIQEESIILDAVQGSPDPGPLPNFSQLHSGDRWQSRRDQGPEKSLWSAGRRSGGGTRHGRQKSLSEAIRTVRTRRGSVSQNAVEIADALKPPVSFKLVILCFAWYGTSILSNASSKAILTALPKPVTLTIVQFLFVCLLCVFSSGLARIYPALGAAAPVLRHGIRRPDREIILVTLPLTAFQIGGHILNSDAMARIPVSLVHTIKGLSPLFTVFAYRAFYNVHYSFATYASLVPLTLGVIMACSASFRAELVGLLYAFGSAVLFVTQNIVSKSLFTEAARAEADGLPARFRKPDKLNLLCYSSGLAFLFTLPIWLWSEGFGLFADFLGDATLELSGRPGSLDHGRLAIEFIFNGTFHFTQSLVAFVLLGLVSPVTYSVASLIKRVFVIVFAIFWFGNPMTNIQAAGIGLTIFGLYLYDRTSDADKADRRLRAKTGASGAPLLPIVTPDSKRSDGFLTAQNGLNIRGSPTKMFSGNPFAKSGPPHDGGSGQGDGWLAPGTKQEDTWTQEERQRAIGVR